MTEPSGRPLPRLAMLRDLTDRTVLDEVFRLGRVTRAELATSTGISKPTISESVRRLETAGLLEATGNQSGGRGRVATFYELDGKAGWVLALEVNQSGLDTSAADLAGRPFDEQHQPPGPPGDVEALVEAVRGTVREALERCGTGRGPLRAVSVSVANPVHPATREIIALRHSPFPEGLLRPAEILSDLTEAPILIDNDVNLAALAERRSGSATEATSCAYVYVGAGLGVSFLLGDQLVRGAHGLAGEIGYLPVTMDSGATTTLAEFLTAQGFGRSDAPSNDVDALTNLLSSGKNAEALRRIGAAVGQAIAAICAVVDPELVLLGGPIGSHPALLTPVRTVVEGIFPGPVRIEAGSIATNAPLRGAVHLATDQARAEMLGAR